MSADKRICRIRLRLFSNVGEAYPAYILPAAGRQMVYVRTTFQKRKISASCFYMKRIHILI